MKEPGILFIQGGGEGAYKEDKKLALFLQNASWSYPGNCWRWASTK